MALVKSFIAKKEVGGYVDRIPACLGLPHVPPSCGIWLSSVADLPGNLHRMDQKFFSLVKDVQRARWGCKLMDFFLLPGEGDGLIQPTGPRSCFQDHSPFLANRALGEGTC